MRKVEESRIGETGSGIAASAPLPTLAGSNLDDGHVLLSHGTNHFLPRRFDEGKFSGRCAPEQGCFILVHAGIESLHRHRVVEGIQGAGGCGCECDRCAHDKESRGVTKYWGDMMAQHQLFFKDEFKPVIQHGDDCFDGYAAFVDPLVDIF